MSTKGTVIIGGGNAGFQVADTLRKGKYTDPITLLCAEDSLPYQRPPLSKKYLAGELATERLLLRPAKYFEDRDITVIPGRTAVNINIHDRIVICDDDSTYPFENLVFATGARVRRLPGTENCTGLLYLRTAADSARINEAAQQASTVVLIGGGFIGLEAAATLREKGKTVTVVEAMPNIMPNLVAPALAEYFTGQHRAHGVEILTETLVQGIGQPATGGYSVTLKTGQSLHADMVIIGIGVIPNTDLAEKTGLATERGILVDEYGQTSLTGVYAAGDCATGINLWTKGHVHLESVQNAVDQATVVGHSILGEKQPYNAVPWFWSDQYDMKLQMAGLSGAHDRYVVRGSMADGRFSIVYFKDGKLIALDSVNTPGDHLAARKLLAAGITPTEADCINTDIPLKTYLTT